MKKSEVQIWMELEALFKADFGPDFTISEGVRANSGPAMNALLRGGMHPEEFRQTVYAFVEEEMSHGQSSRMKRIPWPVPHGKGIQRSRVLAEIIAADANQHPGVTQFREEVLGGTLLKAHEIQPWITQEHEKEQGRPAIVLEVTLPPSSHIHIGEHGGLVPDPPLSVGEQYPAKGSHVELLAYATPDRDWERQVPIGHGGVLSRLHHLSTTLAERYHWQSAQATSFVLTGLTPVLPMIDTTWNSSFLQTPTGNVTALSRIVLTIDPTLSPKEVHNYFQTIRQRILGPKWRDLKESQLKLARFVLRRAPEESWQQRMEAWRKESPPGEEYDNVSNFRRDCQKTIEKLLEPVKPGMPPR